MKRATTEEAKARKTGNPSNLTDAVEMYLIKQSGREHDAKAAPYRDRWLLRDGSKNQPSLLQWAAKNDFRTLQDITSVDVERWRNTWVFRAESYSLKVNHAAIKGFFSWAVKFEFLAKNPFDKLDRLKLTPVPTLPLNDEKNEYERLLAGAGTIRRYDQSLITLIMLMRWSGLAILDACSLKRNTLTPDNTVRTYRQKTGEYVYVPIPSRFR
jgi:integrase/recombinase XerD